MTKHPRNPLLIDAVLSASFFKTHPSHGEEVDPITPPIQSSFASVQRDGKPYKTFYNNYIAPHAVVENGIVFTAHQDGEGRPVVDAYDTQKKVWLGPVRASEFGLGADTHGNPSLAIDREGHLHVFFGCHRKGMRHVRSVSPCDISQWENMSEPTPKAARMSWANCWSVLVTGTWPC